MRRTNFDKIEFIENLMYDFMNNSKATADNVPDKSSFGEFDNIEDGVLYICKNSHYIEYKCPCGCDNVVCIPYYDNNKKESPSWKLSIANGKVTLSPSVFSASWACRSHYFICDNQIQWC